MAQGRKRTEDDDLLDWAAPTEYRSEFRMFIITAVIGIVILALAVYGAVALIGNL